MNPELFELHKQLVALEANHPLGVMTVTEVLNFLAPQVPVMSRMVELTDNKEFIETFLKFMAEVEMYKEVFEEDPNLTTFFYDSNDPEHVKAHQEYLDEFKGGIVKLTDTDRYHCSND